MLRKLVLIICVASLSGCGFQPLYSEKTSAYQGLELVRVNVIQERNGQLLRNRLQDLMTPSGDVSIARYALDVGLVESVRELSFRKDYVARRKELGIKARFTLKDMNTGKTVFSNFSQGYNSFSLGPESAFTAFSSHISEKDAKEKLIENLAQDITRQVANFINIHEVNSSHETNRS